MKRLFIFCIVALLLSCTTDNQSQANKTVENYIRQRIDDPTSLESVSFTKLKKADSIVNKFGKINYYQLDYTFRIKSKGEKKLMKYRFWVGAMDDVEYAEDITDEIKIVR